MIIIFGFIFSINNYIGNVEKTINADGIGYYDYLPSIFIHNDFIRYNDSRLENNSLYQRIDETGVYVDYGNFKVNKYPCGTAILQLPFFSYAYITTQLDDCTDLDGYQKPFQRAVFYAAIFFLFISILLVRKILMLYEIKNSVIILCQVLLVFATTLTQYTNADAGFSHVYSLFAISLFVYLSKQFFDLKRIKYFILACVTLGLIFNIRNPNILIVFFIPFIAGSKPSLVSGFRLLINQKNKLIVGFIIFLAVIAIQLFTWYFQTGNFFVYSYQGEGFSNLYTPEIFNILFSYKKGLFVYTPFLLIAALSGFWFVYKQKYYLFYSWLFFFILLTYVLSSWHSWYYGCSYGLRAYIDYYIIFFIPFAIMLNKIKVAPKLFIMSLALSTIPLNIIQTYQYKEFILHWIDMDEEMYWKVFLKTDDRFKGLIWKNNYDSNLYSTVNEINIGDICLPKNTINAVLNINTLDIPNFNKVSVIQVLIDNDYQENNDTRIILSINKASKDYNYYWHERYLIHFHEKKLNEWQTGFFNFEFTTIDDNQEKTISLAVKTGNQNEYLKNLRLRFLSKTIANTQ